MAYKQPGFSPFTYAQDDSPQHRLNAAIRNNEFEYRECMRIAKNHGPHAHAKCKAARERRQANIDRGWQNL
jgi:hypothetical protein